MTLHSNRKTVKVAFVDAVDRPSSNLEVMTVPETT